MRISGEQRKGKEVVKWHFSVTHIQTNTNWRTPKNTLWTQSVFVLKDYEVSARDDSKLCHVSSLADWRCWYQWRLDGDRMWQIGERHRKTAETRGEGCVDYVCRANYFMMCSGFLCPQGGRGAPLLWKHSIQTSTAPKGYYYHPVQHDVECQSAMRVSEGASPGSLSSDGLSLSLYLSERGGEAVWRGWGQML